MVAARLAELTLGKDDRILLATGWSEGYRADYVYYGFAVDGSGNVRYVEDCGEAMSKRVLDLHGSAKVDGFRGSPRDLLLSIPLSVAEKYEFGAETTPIEPDLKPETIGAGDVPAEIKLDPHGLKVDALVCLMQGDDGLCLATSAQGGDSYTHPLNFDSTRGPVEIYVSTADGTRETARSATTIPLPSRSESAVSIEIDVSADLNLAVRVGQ